MSRHLRAQHSSQARRVTAPESGRIEQSRASIALRLSSAQTCAGTRCLDCHEWDCHEWDCNTVSQTHANVSRRQERLKVPYIVGTAQVSF